MLPPKISFICWNRLGLTAKNLKHLLETKEDFELHIIDNNSYDNTFDYLKSIEKSDNRIKEIKRFNKNNGVVYAVNYVLSQRKIFQDFIHIENDVSILTDNWIQNCLNLLKEFPEVGILGNVRKTYFEKHDRNIPFLKIIRNNISFLKTENILGCCLYFNNKILEKIGYLDERSYGDYELNNRIKKMNLWLGFCESNIILQNQEILCKDCLAKCPKFDNLSLTPFCIKLYRQKRYSNKDFLNLLQSIPILDYNNFYCSSIHDANSQKVHEYNFALAKKIFDFFKNNDNKTTK